MFMNRDIEKEINKYPTYLQWQTQDFWDGRERSNHKEGANLFFSLFFQKTARKWKELGMRGSFVSCAPLFVSANGHDDLD